MPKNGLPLMRPKAVGLPGFTAMPWKSTSPRAEHVEDQVALADRAAAGEHEHVFLQAFVDRARQVVDRVGRGAVRHRDAAVLGDDRREREPVDVVDLAGRERLAGFDDLVAGRENGDARRA